MIGGEYLPKPGQEQATYEALWKIASPLDTDLSGKDAVDFFRKSGVDSGFLKQIWGLSTPSATMNHSQFVTALRLITMVQNGDFPLSRERLVKSADMNYGPTSNYPKFPSLQQHTTTSTTVPSAQRAAATHAPAVSNGNNPEHQVYAITPDDHAKYYNLFKGYDTNGDGYLTGSESVAILAQSGLDQVVLRAIWELADQNKDNQLSSKEFCVAFHLILCVSKKKLPLPVSLPPPLINFLKNAPLVPGTHVPPISVPAVIAPVAALTINTSSARRPSLTSNVSSHIPEANASVYSSSHTSGNINILPLRSPPKTPKINKPASFTSSTSIIGGNDYGASSVIGGGGGSYNDTNEMEITNQVTGMRDLSRRALQAGDIAVEANEVNTGSLKLVLQRLAQEKIALTAAVSTAETQARESSAKLNDIVEEIKVLEAQCSELRRQVDDTRSSTSTTQGQISERTNEKQALLQQISAVRSAIAAQSKDVSMMAIDVGKSEGQRAELGERELFLENEMKNTQMDINQINNELVALQNILAALNGDKDARGAELTRLQSQKTASQAALVRQRSAIEKREHDLEELKREKKELNDSRNHVINQVSSQIIHGNTSASACSNIESSNGYEDFAASTPAAAVAPAKTTAAPVATNTSTTSAVPKAALAAFTIEKPSTTTTSTKAATQASALKASAETKIAFSSPPKTLKKVPSKSTNTPTSNKTVLIRTHSMNNKTGETDPFDDFTAKGGGDSNKGGEISSGEFSPRDSKDNEPAVVIPFDNTEDFFASFNNNSSDNTSISAGVASVKVTSTASPPIDDSGFDSNPFEDPVNLSPRLATTTDNDDDGFTASSSTKAVHFTASTKVKSVGDKDSNKDNDGFETSPGTTITTSTTVDDGFGISSSGFDKNPFDDSVAFDAFGTSGASSNGQSSTADGFGSVSPFDAFGDESTSAVASSSSTSGFDEW